YRVDGGDWQTYALPVWVSGTGNHTVDFYSTDNAGNVEGWHSVGFRIDSTAPLTTISLDGAAGDDYWFHSIVTVDIAATDAGSGVDAIQYRLDGGTSALMPRAFERRFRRRPCPSPPRRPPRARRFLRLRPPAGTPRRFP